jgi:hypothetical protein
MMVLGPSHDSAVGEKESDWSGRVRTGSTRFFSDFEVGLGGFIIKETHDVDQFYWLRRRQRQMSFGFSPMKA